MKPYRLGWVHGNWGTYLGAIRVGHRLAWVCAHAHWETWEARACAAAQATAEGYKTRPAAPAPEGKGE